MTFRILLGAAALALSGAAAVAQEALSLKTLAAGAAAIVETRVARVDYALGPGGAGGGALPYAVVTFEVLRRVGDAAAPKTFRLRAPGGPDGSGGFYEVENAPVFQTGDVDVLFVRENGTAQCPLMDCAGGRFRVLDESVYSGEGAPLLGLDADARPIARGRMPQAFLTLRYPAPGFDALMRNPLAQEALKRLGLSLEEARKRYAAEAPGVIEIARVEVEPDKDDQPARAAQKPMARDAFWTRVVEAATGVHSPKAVPDFDPETPLKPPSFTAAAPPDAPAPSGPAPSEEEKRGPKSDFSRFRAVE